MVQPYNLTNITGANDLVGIIGTANSLVGNLFAILTLLLVFAVVFVASKNYFTREAASAAAFITAISSILFFMLGWVDQRVMMMCIVILALIMAWQRITSD